MEREESVLGCTAWVKQRLRGAWSAATVGHQLTAATLDNLVECFGNLESAIKTRVLLGLLSLRCVPQRNLIPSHQCPASSPTRPPLSLPLTLSLSLSLSLLSLSRFPAASPLTPIRPIPSFHFAVSSSSLSIHSYGDVNEMLRSMHL
jgi:hypothetical protein